MAQNSDHDSFLIFRKVSLREQVEILAQAALAAGKKEIEGTLGPDTPWETVDAVASSVFGETALASGSAGQPGYQFLRSFSWLGLESKDGQFARVESPLSKAGTTGDVSFAAFDFSKKERYAAIVRHCLAGVTPPDILWLRYVAERLIHDHGMRKVFLGFYAHTNHYTALDNESWERHLKYSVHALARDEIDAGMTSAFAEDVAPDEDQVPKSAIGCACGQIAEYRAGLFGKGKLIYHSA